MLFFAKMAASSGKNVNHMVLSTSGPSLVLLEESEPIILFIALTPMTMHIFQYFAEYSGSRFPNYTASL